MPHPERSAPTRLGVPTPRSDVPEGSARGDVRVLWIAVVLALVVYGAQVLSMGSAPADDAFISMRFARNLVEGHGLVYNPGERVEGYTNFLYTVLLAVPYLIGTDPLAFLHGLGIVSGLMVLAAAAALARLLAPERIYAPGLAALVAAGTPFLVAESVMGLETAFFAGLSGLALAALLARPQRPVASGLLFAAAALTRPEGLLVSGLAGLFDLGRIARDPAARRAFLVRWSIVLGVVAAHLTFRILYYGDIVPNTFHAKVGGGAAAIARGLEYGGEFAWRAAPLILLSVVALVSAVRRGGRVRTATLLVFSVALVYVVYSTYVGGDFKRTYRFFAVPAVLWAGLSGAGAVRIADRWPRAAVAGAMTIAIAAAAGMWSLNEPARRFVAQRVGLYPHHIAVGAWLRENFPPDTWLATVNAGAIPYESRLRTIDMVGLCDAHIARVTMPDMGAGVAGHEKSDPDYVLDRRPDIVLFQAARLRPEPLPLSQMRFMLQWTAEHELWAHPRFQAEYRLRSADIGFAYFNYFERIDRSTDAQR